jgi:hypothetical protein
MSISSVKFHVKSDDYFGTLATILSLVKQDILDDKVIKKHHIKI